MFTKKKTIRRYIRFYGIVQAVGFRYYAKSSADLYGATGWVCNEYDGSVSMEIQGTEDQIGDVIAGIKRGTYISIDRMEVRDIGVIPDERGFRVRYR